MGTGLGKGVRKLKLDEKVQRLELEKKLAGVKNSPFGHKLQKLKNRKDMRDTASFDVYFEPDGLEDQVKWLDKNEFLILLTSEKLTGLQAKRQKCNETVGSNRKGRS